MNNTNKQLSLKLVSSSKIPFFFKFQAKLNVNFPLKTLAMHYYCYVSKNHYIFKNMQIK